MTDRPVAVASWNVHREFIFSGPELDRVGEEATVKVTMYGDPAARVAIFNRALAAFFETLGVKQK